MAEENIDRNNILTDLESIEHNQRKKQAQANTTNNNYQNMVRQKTAAVSAGIINAKANFCPFCKEYSLTRHTSNDSFRTAPAVSFAEAPLMLANFGNRPELWMYIQESHPNVISALQEKQKVQGEHRARINKKNWLLSLLRNNNNNPQQRIEAAAALGADPKTELFQVVQEIFDVEGAYNFLKDARKKYEAQLMKAKNSVLEWKRNNIPFYDDRFGIGGDRERN